MEVLGGLYRSKQAHRVEEKHGGATLNEDVYWYLAIYGKTVGVYGSGPNDYRRYFSKRFDLNGLIFQMEDKNFKFFVDNPYTNRRIIFEAKVIDDGECLILKAYDEGASDKLWIEGTFDRINTGDRDNSLP